MDNHQAFLRIKIDNERPVELIDLTTSLMGFADEYKRWLDSHPEAAPADDVKLFVHEIRPGCIEADLVAMSSAFIPLMENAQTVIEFGKSIKSGIEALFKNDAAKKPDARTCQNLSRLVGLVAKDGGAQLNIGAIENFAPVVTININSSEANSLQDLASKRIAEIQEPNTKIHERMVLYWHQARNELHSSSGDRACIDKLHKKSLKVIFANDDIKKQMIFDDENFFKFFYVVDVEVQCAQEKPVAYKILAFHERFER